MGVILKSIEKKNIYDVVVSYNFFLIFFFTFQNNLKADFCPTVK